MTGGMAFAVQSLFCPAMRRSLLTLSIIALSLTSATAAVRLDVFSGRLYGQGGTTPLPDGSLLLLIASTGDAVFTPPNSDSFVGASSDDVIVASFDLQSNTAGFTGSNLEAIVFELGGTITEGDPLRLVWFPNIPYNAATNYQTAAPALGSAYGTFRTDNPGADGSTSAWVVPADGQNHSLNFATQSIGGSQPDVFGVADYLVPVPEPSSAAVLLVSALCLGVRRRERARSRGLPEPI